MGEEIWECEPQGLKPRFSGHCTARLKPRPFKAIRDESPITFPSAEALGYNRKSKA